MPRKHQDGTITSHFSLHQWLECHQRELWSCVRAVLLSCSATASDAHYPVGNSFSSRAGKHRPNPLRRERVVLESCKPNSVCAACATERIICLSDQYPGLIPLARDRNGPLPSPLFGLAPDGVFRAASLALRAVGSYPTFSPLPRACARGGMFSVALSVGTARAVTTRVYRRPDRRYAASRPMVFGLSSPTRSRESERFSALQNQ